MRKQHPDTPRQQLNDSRKSVDSGPDHSSDTPFEERPTAKASFNRDPRKSSANPRPRRSTELQFKLAMNQNSLPKPLVHLLRPKNSSMEEASFDQTGSALEESSEIPKTSSASDLQLVETRRPSRMDRIEGESHHRHRNSSDFQTPLSKNVGLGMPKQIMFRFRDERPKVLKSVNKDSGDVTSHHSSSGPLKSELEFRSKKVQSYESMSCSGSEYEVADRHPNPYNVSKGSPKPLSYMVSEINSFRQNMKILLGREPPSASPDSRLNQSLSRNEPRIYSGNSPSYPSRGLSMTTGRKVQNGSYVEASKSRGKQKVKWSNLPESRTPVAGPKNEKKNSTLRCPQLFQIRRVERTKTNSHYDPSTSVNKSHKITWATNRFPPKGTKIKQPLSAHRPHIKMSMDSRKPSSIVQRIMSRKSQNSNTSRAQSGVSNASTANMKPLTKPSQGKKQPPPISIPTHANLAEKLGPLNVYDIVGRLKQSHFSGASKTPRAQPTTGDCVYRGSGKDSLATTSLQANVARKSLNTKGSVVNEDKPGQSKEPNPPKPDPKLSKPYGRAHLATGRLVSGPSILTTLQAPPMSSLPSISLYSNLAPKSHNSPFGASTPRQVFNLAHQIGSKIAESLQKK